MKKIILKALYLIAVFFAALFFVSSAANYGNEDMTMEMSAPTLPVLHMVVDGWKVNKIHGSHTVMDCAYQRDSITPLGTGRTTGIVIDKYDQEIKKIFFEVRSIDGKRLIESTEITGYQETESVIRADLVLKDLMEKQKEYVLIVILENGYGNEIRYYTRIRNGEGTYAEEKLAYVVDFHNKTFDKEAAKELTRYLESDATGDNSTFGKVDIHSSFHQVTWGDLEVERLTDPEVTIKELASQTGALEVSYMAGIGSGDSRELCQVKEYYWIRYTADRIYLLDFERRMQQIYQEKKEPSSSEYLSLGILLEEDVDLKESEGGNILAFTDGRRLFSYHLDDHKFSRLFSFYDGNYSDPRECLSRHGIKIMNIDEAGNIQFLVYGYMNRGRHEGETGISVYLFSGPSNTVEEQVYIPVDTSFEVLKAELEELAYINHSDLFYFMQGGAIHSVNLQNRESETIVSGLKEESCRVSDSEHMVVWQSEEETQLHLMNLNTGTQDVLRAEEGECLIPLGFMQEDLIYGAARQEDRIEDPTGNSMLPMHSIYIRDEEGKILKTYREEGIYLTDAVIEGNQITLSRLGKDEERGYYAVSDDQIISAKQETEGSNVVETITIETYGKVVRLSLGKNMDLKKYKLLTPKEVLFEGDREIFFEKGEQEPFYLVYGKNGVEGIFTDVGNAVNTANAGSGVVVNERGAIVWYRGNLSVKNQIMAVKGELAVEERSSMAVCLDTMLQLEGIVRSSEQLLARGDSPVRILEEHMEGIRVLDLTGCTLDTVLYYVNQDIPVLVSMKDGNAVLLVGFNELNTVIMNPLTGEVSKLGMKDSEQLFKDNGNVFITYMREE